MYVTSGLTSKDSVTKRTRFLMKLVRKMAQQKVFLMVCDRFDESVLVLRKILGLPSLSATYDGLGYHPGSSTACGEKELMLYFIQKQASAHTKNSSHSNYNQGQGQEQVVGHVDNETRTMQMLDQLQPFDNALYFAANKILDRYLAVYNESPATTTTAAAATPPPATPTTATTTAITTTTVTTNSPTTYATANSESSGEGRVGLSLTSLEYDLGLYHKLLDEARLYCGASNSYR